MTQRSICLKTIFLFLLLGTSGCIAMNPAPATKTDLHNETQRLHDIVELHSKQLNRQQAELSSQLNVDLKEIQKKLTVLDSTIKTQDAAKPATVIISNEKCPDPPPGQTPDGKLLLGEAEWLWLDAADQVFRARIDTGADTSSISAAGITIFERNSKKWVRFTMSHQDIAGRINIETPLVRHVRVRQASSKSFDRRPVVRLAMRIGDHNEKTEFTLTDRSSMKFPVMLGRDFLKDIAMVDVAHTYIQPKPRLKDVR